MDINVNLTTKEYCDHVCKVTNVAEPIADEGSYTHRYTSIYYHDQT